VETDDIERSLGEETVAATRPAREAEAPTHDLSATEELGRGATLGRYTVLDRIGSGGMGVVYAAYDPQLDRRVALKVLHPGRDVDMATSDGRGRLLREAQSMAKLSHPNVITVHDVGTVGDRVFVAMEFIDGSTLRDWLKAPRDWPDVVEAFVRAGRGLAAAHAAGLVHRDFKPDNVLIGQDGRVLVMDFGLARQTASTSGMETTSGDAMPTPSSPNNLVLTRTGAMLGTPAYMAPEQHRGVAADPLADQFSFCVALYEGLYGERPFPGRNVAALAMSILEGRIREPPKGTRVPQWMRQVVLRGLNLSASDRYPSMDALLAELQRDPPQTRRPWLGVAIAVGVALVITGAYLWTRPPVTARCPDSEGQMRASYDETVRARIRQAFATTAGGVGDATATVVIEDLDEWASQWTAAHTRACTSSGVRGTDAITADDVPQMRCLDVLRGRMVALADVLQEPHPAVVEHAVFAVQRLPAPASCEERLRLAKSDLQPTRNGQQQRLRDLRRNLARTAALRSVGRAGEAVTTVEASVRSAGGLEDPGLVAEAMLEHAAVLEAAGDVTRARRALQDAVLESARGDRADIEAEAWTAMTYLLARESAHARKEQEVLLGAESALARAGDPAGLRGELEHAIGRLYLANGAWEDAYDRLVVARKIRLRQHGPDHVDVAVATLALGLAEEGMGQFPAAASSEVEALAVFERALGPRHRDVASSLARLGTAELGAGAVLRADADFARARVILEPAPDADADALDSDTARALADTLDRYGQLRRSEQKYEEAAAMHRRAVALLESATGGNPADLGYPLLNLAVALLDLGNNVEATEHLERVRELWRRALGPDHPDLGYAELALGKVRWLAGDHLGAHGAYARALAIWDETLPEDHPLLGYALTGLGRSQLALSNVPEAVGSLERALAIRDDEAEDRLNLAETSLALSRALWVTGADTERALELAAQARSLSGAYEPVDEEGLRQLLDGQDVPALTDRLEPAALGTSNRHAPDLR
jgi:predicted Ser/Thr protein kinase